MHPDISIKPFDDLTAIDVYQILKARSQVFVVEQHCAYQDMDDKDFDCLHLVAHSNEALMGYCRILPPAPSKLLPELGASPGIGRVLVLPAYRGQTLARQIMLDAINYCHKKYGKKPIIISAQSYLTHFYESLGFVTQGLPYSEDGIEHITMVLMPAKKVQKYRGAGAQVMVFLLLALAIAFIAGLVYLMI